MASKSEDIIVEAPLSFTGSKKRIMRLSDSLLLKICLLFPLLLLAWCFISVWYLFFGILLIPYRMARRSSRKQKVDKLRHKELLEALEAKSTK